MQRQAIWRDGYGALLEGNAVEFGPHKGQAVAVEVQGRAGPAGRVRPDRQGGDDAGRRAGKIDGQRHRIHQMVRRAIL